ncbi:MAG: bifunctional ornithine acetyltransferase/N-acetylglutamate synthase, partial [Proteobacteria bacterium]|nr:bifunctional ornithine acetyltransferase/N-acetylglutamate synthase [Pseudomonadota bacterium]
MNAKPTQPALSPLAPKSFPRMPAVAGVALAAGACGLAKSGRRDVVLVELGP